MRFVERKNRAIPAPPAMKNDAEFAMRKRPCLQYQIKRCPGPCVYDVDRDVYGVQVNAVGLFLEGRHDAAGWTFTQWRLSARTLLERAAHFTDQHTPAPRGKDDLAAILYTSGTTGRSKGAMLTHGNMLSNARVLKDYWGWVKGDVLLHALPIFHVHGLFVASHGALLNGSKMIWMARFDPAAVVRRLPEATVFMGVPTLYVRLLAEPGFTREAKEEAVSCLATSPGMS